VDLSIAVGFASGINVSTAVDVNVVATISKYRYKCKCDETTSIDYE
jgi:hypothetical protein